MDSLEDLLFGGNICGAGIDIHNVGRRVLK
jgi:hypothetical protein